MFELICVLMSLSLIKSEETESRCECTIKDATKNIYPSSLDEVDGRVSYEFLVKPDVHMHVEPPGPV